MHIRKGKRCIQRFHKVNRRTMVFVSFVIKENLSREDVLFNIKALLNNKLYIYNGSFSKILNIRIPRMAIIDGASCEILYYRRNKFVCLLKYIR